MKDTYDRLLFTFGFVPELPVCARIQCTVSHSENGPTVPKHFQVQKNLTNQYKYQKNEVEFISLTMVDHYHCTFDFCIVRNWNHEPEKQVYSIADTFINYVSIIISSVVIGPYFFEYEEGPTVTVKFCSSPFFFSRFDNFRWSTRSPELFFFFFEITGIIVVMWTILSLLKLCYLTLLLERLPFDIFLLLKNHL